MAPTAKQEHDQEGTEGYGLDVCLGGYGGVKSTVVRKEETRGGGGLM